MFQHTPYDIHPDHLNKWFLSFSEVFKGVCGVCSNGITKFHHWNRETSSGFSPISGYLLLTVQRRSLKSTLPAEKGQLWVSWLAKIATKRKGFGVCGHNTRVGFWCVGWIWGYTGYTSLTKSSGSWFSSLNMENASTNQTLRGLVAPGVPWGCCLSSCLLNTIPNYFKNCRMLIWAVTSSSRLFPVDNNNFDIQKKHKSSNIHVSLASSPVPGNSHHQDYYLFIYTSEVENSSLNFHWSLLLARGDNPRFYQLDKFSRGILPKWL